MKHLNFIQEVCYDITVGGVSVGKLCLPIISSPTVPGSTTEDTGELERSGWSLIRSSKGEVMTATLEVGSSNLAFINRLERREEYTTKVFTFIRDDKEFFSLRGRAHHASSETQQCAKLSILGKGEGVDYRMTVSLESCRTIRVNVESGGATHEKTVDLVSPDTLLNEPELGLCKSLTETISRQLEPFNDLLVFINEYYWTKSRRDMGELLNQLTSPTGGGVMISWGCALAHAGCWAAGGAGTALCCGATAILGCALCGTGFGGAASWCSDNVC